MEITFPSDYPTRPFFRCVSPRFCWYTGHADGGRRDLHRGLDDRRTPAPAAGHLRRERARTVFICGHQSMSARVACGVPNDVEIRVDGVGHFLTTR